MTRYFIDQMCFTHGVIREYHEDCPGCNNLYPCVIQPARYSGVYEGGPWTAFACYAEDIPKGATDSDVECMEWWMNPTVLVAVGNSPNEAYLNLVKRARQMNDAEATDCYVCDHVAPDVPHDCPGDIV